MGEFLDQLGDLLQDAQKSKNAAGKERRQFGVKGSEPLLAVLRHYTREWDGFSEHDWAGVDAARVFSMRGQGLSLRATVNLILAGVYHNLDADTDRSLSVKMSDKSFSPDEGQLSHRKVFSTFLRETRESKGRVPRLSEVLVRFGKRVPSDIGNASLPMNDVPYFRRILALAVTSGLSSRGLVDTDEKAQFIADYPHPCEANLYAKLYFNRGDFRAYIHDSSVLRNFCGAIINALFSPVKGGTHSTDYNMNKVNPPKNGNIISAQGTLEGEALGLVQGDVSSFTASAINSWILGFAAGVVLEDKDFSHLNTPFVVLVDSNPVEVTLQAILRIYLYLTVLCPVYDTTTRETYHSTGGHLGIAGNMTLTKLAFTISIMNVKKFVEEKYSIRFRPQIGGDDFFVMNMGIRLYILTAIYLLKGTITEEVGALKEYNIHLYEAGIDVRNGPQFTFCKKRLSVEVTVVGAQMLWSIRSVWHCPIFNILLELPRAGVVSKLVALKKYREFESGVRSVTNQHPQRFYYYSLLMTLFERIHGKPSYQNLMMIRQMPDLRLVQDGHVLLSPDTLKSFDGMPEIVDSIGWHYRVHPREKAFLKVQRGQLHLRELEDDQGRKQTVILSERELKSVDRVATPGYVTHGPIPDPDMIRSCENLIREIRDYLNNSVN